jgi:hypothetical protein
MSGTKILRFKTIKNPLDNMSVWFNSLRGLMILFTPKALQVTPADHLLG